ncbi:MAG: hypothetical protein PHS97_06755 [Oscillospiraceae bacterium]|nr:hypothetical protein [Oscillospiraceae bacterium]
MRRYSLFALFCATALVLSACGASPAAPPVAPDDSSADRLIDPSLGSAYVADDVTMPASSDNMIYAIEALIYQSYANGGAYYDGNAAQDAAFWNAVTYLVNFCKYALRTAELTEDHIYLPPETVSQLAGTLYGLQDCTVLPAIPEDVFLVTQDDARYCFGLGEIGLMTIQITACDARSDGSYVLRADLIALDETEHALASYAITMQPTDDAMFHYAVTGLETTQLYAAADDAMNAALDAVAMAAALVGDYLGSDGQTEYQFREDYTCTVDGKAGIWAVALTGEKLYLTYTLSGESACVSNLLPWDAGFLLLRDNGEILDTLTSTKVSG